MSEHVSSQAATRQEGLAMIRRALRARGDQAIEVDYRGPIFIVGPDQKLVRPKTTSADAGWMWAEGLPPRREHYYLLVDVENAHDMWIVPTDFVRGAVQGRHQQWHSASPRSRALEQDLRVLDRWTVDPFRNAWSSLALPANATGHQAILAALRPGTVYRRNDLIELGLLGDEQKGISYPADGDHVVLFTGGRRHNEYGYVDRWLGGEFEYFGEWRGPGDMLLERGNLAITQRQHELYLFEYVDGSSHRYVGRFSYVSHDTREVDRSGSKGKAIVFKLRPMD